MPLPNISTPSFTAKLPTTGQEISYRPFLVKEEKILLMAMEGGDKTEIRKAIDNIVSSCVLDDIDVTKVPMIDIEYIFLMLRSKSVGEVITFNVGHSKGDCHHKTSVEVNLNDVVVDGEVRDGVIMITDSIGVKMHYPTTKILDSLDEDNQSRVLLNMVAQCIDVVFDSDDVYDNFTNDELVEWLGNLNRQQYEKIADFIASAPKLTYKLKWKCQSCGEDDEVTIEGLYNFFI